MDTITILLADDNALVRKAWSFIFKNDGRFRLIAECTSGEEAVSSTKSLCPDIVLMDISLPGMDGIEATKQISTQVPGSRVLGMSMHANPDYAIEILQGGAKGYITKSSPIDEIFTAILEVYNGSVYICNEIRNNLSGKETSK